MIDDAIEKYMSIKKRAEELAQENKKLSLEIAEVRTKELDTECLYSNLVDAFIEVRKERDAYKEALRHYAGEPFETNDIYMDIFDLFKVVNGSVTEFDGDKFAEVARTTLEKYKE